jgi:acyl carrier protein phosphodiesterase
MNFLAHFYLSDTSEQLITGNFLGDMVRKVEWKNYSPEVIEGIKMHQQIDYFTDTHTIVKRHKALLTPKHNHFSGVILDIFYDYFLASTWEKHHKTDLPTYATWVYQALGNEESLFTPKAKMAFNHMKKHNWLTAYSTMDGIDQVLKGMSQRTRFDSNMGNSIIDLKTYQEEMSEEFREFFKELKREFTDNTDNSLLIL